MINSPFKFHNNKKSFKRDLTGYFCTQRSKTNINYVSKDKNDARLNKERRLQ